MNTADFISSHGRLVRAGAGSPACRAFVPAQLPAQLDWDSELIGLVSASDRALGQLSSVGQMVPNPHLLIRPFVRREAVQSSRIEGTRATVDELYLFEASSAATPGSDADEVHNYVAAFEHGLRRSKALPLSRRLLCEMHEVLMSGVRGQECRIGEFRRQQNWIGPPGCTIEHATYVPPPPQELNESFSQLEEYLNTPSDLPPLVRLAMVHYQFEAIHPFEDGNGRIGRLLIVLALCMDGVLSGPLLYISDALERRRAEYYEHLLRVSTESSWSDWIKFFLHCAIATARDGTLRAHRLLDLQTQYRKRFAKSRAATTMPLIDELFITPAVTIRQVAEKLQVTPTSASRAIDRLVAAGILREVTAKGRNRVFVAGEIIRAIADQMIG